MKKIWIILSFLTIGGIGGFCAVWTYNMAAGEVSSYYEQREKQQEKGKVNGKSMIEDKPDTGGKENKVEKSNKSEKNNKKVADGERTNKVNLSDWRLILVNRENKMPENYDIKLTRLKNGHAIDSRCYKELQEMFDDCRKEGLSPVICSSFRSWDKQNKLFYQEVNKYLGMGYGLKYAKSEAEKSVAIPGTSEHQLGLALDIVDINYQLLDDKQENTPVQRWLFKNSWKYGFILRYPNEKRKITGIIYEPWHYRYVGKEAAKEIHSQNICLEEYLNRLGY